MGSRARHDRRPLGGMQAQIAGGGEATAIGARQTRRSVIFVNRFFHPDHSATSQILSDLAFHLARAGERVRVVASQGLYDDPRAVLPAFEEIDGVAVHRVARARFGRAALAGRALDYLDMYRSFAAATAGIARPGDVLVAKTDPPLLSVALAPVARLKRLALVNWLQDLYPEVALGLGLRALAPAAPVLTAARNASLKAATINVAIGELMAERIAAIGVPAGRIAVVPNWCDDAAIRPEFFHANPLRSEWGLGGKFVVGYSGNLGRAHEYETLLGAAELLRDQTDLVFLFIGGGHFAGPLKAAVEARGLAAMFRFQPYQPAQSLPLSLSLPDLHWLSLVPEMEGLIVPSKFYGVAAAGRPTLAIVDPDGEIGRLVRAHCCGVQVDPGDARALAAAIVALRADPARVAELGRNARALAERRFGRAQAFAAWRRLLDGVGGPVSVAS